MLGEMKGMFRDLERDVKQGMLQCRTQKASLGTGLQPKLLQQHYLKEASQTLSLLKRN